MPDEPAALEPQANLELIRLPDEVHIRLGVKASRALEYLKDKLRPHGFDAPGADDLLDLILVPMIKATHTKDITWRDRLIASKGLAELVGIYMAAELSTKVRSWRALPRRGTGKAV